ncbi:hypothetical protein QEW_4559 [Clostridioides difficile CD160]|nr:hypothetical protein QEW_4559 [Clostridioides difficile CD160]
MIKIILCNTVDEYIEYERVQGTKDCYLIDIIIGDKCTEKEAEKALSILQNSKFKIVSETEKLSWAFDLIQKGLEQGVKESSKTKQCCERCGASVDSSEQLTSMPILSDYNNTQDVSDQLGSIDICPVCLQEVTRICNSPF